MELMYISYKLNVVNAGSASCRNSDYPENGIKIELRLGFYVDYNGDHGSWIYKHWSFVLP